MMGLAAGAQVVEPQLCGSKQDKATHYNTERKVSPKSRFIVVSKKDLRLYVYGTSGRDTLLLAKYPVCLSKNKGQKQRRGDMKTPSCTASNPFSITMIQNSAGWTHDFGDGRGSIKSYGNWFMRLKTPGHNGIGIHGSTNNESSVPGRASEGCIRLRDRDIIDLKERYAFVGMKVIILDEEQEGLPCEKRAHRAVCASH